MSDTNAPADSGQGGAPVSTSAAVSAAPAAPAAPTSAQVAAPAPAPVAQPVSWLPDADETLTGYVQNKGWDTPAKAVDSYRNLEKLLGADKAGNAVVIPKEGADPKEWAAVYDRLGRPTGPDGYKVAVPEGGNAELQTAVLAKAHELGLSKAQGEGLIGWYNEQAAGILAKEAAAKAAAFQQEDAAIKTEWGSAYTQNLAAAQAAARGLGLDGQTIDKMSEALGHKATMQLLNKIGTRMQEPGFVAGDKTEQFGNAMTPGQAKAEIQSLTQDKGWVAKLMAKDATALARWDQLHRYAFPE